MYIYKIFYGYIGTTIIPMKHMFTNRWRIWSHGTRKPDNTILIIIVSRKTRDDSRNIQKCLPSETPFNSLGRGKVWWQIYRKPLRSFHHFKHNDTYCDVSFITNSKKKKKEKNILKWLMKCIIFITFSHPYRVWCVLI